MKFMNYHRAMQPKYHPNLTPPHLRLQAGTAATHTTDGWGLKEVRSLALTVLAANSFSYETFERLVEIGMRALAHAKGEYMPELGIPFQAYAYVSVRAVMVAAASTGSFQHRRPQRMVPATVLFDSANHARTVVADLGTRIATYQADSDRLFGSNSCSVGPTMVSVDINSLDHPVLAHEFDPPKSGGDPEPSSATLAGELETALALFCRVSELSPDIVAKAHAQVSPSKADLDAWLVDSAAAIAHQRDQGNAMEAEKDPLQAARDRGRHHALAELQKPENLSLRDAAAYAGRSDRAINEARIKGQLYALVPPGKQRGLRYPQWQFDAEADRLAAVLAPFIEAGASCWVVHNFMQRPHHALGDVRPMDWVLDPAKSLEPVVDVVRKRYAGDQGAA